MNGRRLRAELLQHIDEDVTRQILARNNMNLLSTDVEITYAAQLVGTLEKRESMRQEGSVPSSGGNVSHRSGERSNR